MEIVIIIAALAVLVVGYFCLGLILKFLVSWWILALGVPVLVTVGLLGGWVGAGVALLGFFFILSANNEWSDSSLCRRLEARIDRAFYLSDT